MRARKARALGALAGLPMTIKDGFDVENMPATAGNPALHGSRQELRRCRLVARTRAAGAVIWGKTNVPFMLSDLQSYNAIYGTTNNPYDVTRVPGGSSGGAAAALATGITPLEIGSDIGGSLRHPANFCGVTALEADLGRAADARPCSAAARHRCRSRSRRRRPDGAQHRRSETAVERAEQNAAKPARRDGQGRARRGVGRRRAAAAVARRERRRRARRRCARQTGRACRDASRRRSIRANC